MRYIKTLLFFFFFYFPSYLLSLEIIAVLRKAKGLGGTVPELPTKCSPIIIYKVWCENTGSIEVLISVYSSADEEHLSYQ